jgi:hypothetical protein
MKLTDAEILELNELCGAVVDGTLSDTQRTRLSGWLGASEAARRYYVQALGQSASLHSYASEIHAEAPDVPAVPRGKIIQLNWWVFGSLAAAVLLLAFWLGNGRTRPATPVALPAGESVARITGAKNSRWADGAPAIQPGDHVHRGQRLELLAGLAEITFDSGASVVLEGPASLDVNSAWDGTLRRGTLKASVPPEAIGFRISNPAVDVVDLGTEFTMIADGQGAADVLVLKGEVEAAPRAVVDVESILLHEKESRRFAASGMSAVSDSEVKFARFAQPLALDRFSPAIHFVHWGFDEAGGDLLQAGPAQRGYDARLTVANAAELAASRVAGHRGRALHFDSRLYAKARFPGISGSAPRTVAFWVRVPEDAQLSDAFTMVAWATNVPKLRSRPVHINWNRNPAEGPLGALRTDFGGGSAMGTTSLRDGRWHHVAVYFAPGEETSTPVQVKLYVDGRLESSTVIAGRIRAPLGREDPALTDFVWLGCRIGNGGPRQDRFRGDIDELFITDRGLEPNEIVALMNENRLPSSALATNP